MIIRRFLVGNVYILCYYEFLVVRRFIGYRYFVRDIVYFFLDLCVGDGGRIIYFVVSGGVMGSRIFRWFVIGSYRFSRGDFLRIILIYYRVEWLLLNFLVVIYLCMYYGVIGWGWGLYYGGRKEVSLCWGVMYFW